MSKIDLTDPWLLDDLDLGFMDAIHIPIMVVEAAEFVKHGDPIRFTDESKTKIEIAGALSTPDGIVNPFLDYSFSKGQKVLIFVRPNLTSGMRHVFNFEEEEETECSSMGCD